MTPQEQEILLLTRRVIALENQKTADYSRVISDIHQQFLGMNERLNALNPVFHNINARLDAHGKDIQSLKAGLDTILIQTEENRVKLQNLKPTISIWPSWR